LILTVLRIVSHDPHGQSRIEPQPIRGELFLKKSKGYGCDFFRIALPIENPFPFEREAHDESNTILSIGRAGARIIAGC